MPISENIKTIQDNIRNICDQWDRDPKSVDLLAVSKRQPIGKIEEALKSGHRIYGENKVQEAQEHWAELRPQYPDLQLHLIGPLQTNKVKDAVALFDVIHTIDREKLALKLAEQMEIQKRSLPCFIQVNIGEEEQKSGIMPQDLDEFIHFCRDECGLNIIGLMCIPPFDEPPAMYFALLNKMAEAHGLTQLSMGMSADYERAIALGATHIRVGTDVFGARHD